MNDWRKEFQYLLDRKMLSADELAYLFGQIKSIVEANLAEAEKLKEFARHVIKQECWGYYDLDGGEIQDLAEKLGLIEKHIATEDDADSDFEVGDVIFKFSEVLKGE